uniref:Tubby-like F-box protein n=1 Tax=Ananas comosus var. bracteatus TaxID=296719 RepID=A0A6V7NYW2_ANACO|nr:unnamed protein product [Ananas comosus var. bracteatus]
MSRRMAILSRRSSSSWPFSSFSGGLSGEPRISPAEAEAVAEEAAEDEGRWSRMIPELLAEIVRRVEAGAERWPPRKDVVSCACVCRRWREVAKGVVRPPAECGKITFPSSLKQPGPRDFPIQCFIKRNKRNSTFYLYLGLTQSFIDKGKFLLAARRFRHGAHTEYIISLDADDLSQGSSAYMGKLRSDFLGTKFAIYDTRPPIMILRHHYAAANPAAGLGASGSVPSSLLAATLKSARSRTNSTFLNPEDQEECIALWSPTVLRNKAPRWHEHLQCWCLNFHGRVTVASVKNFQLVAAVGDEETVLLQFGKVGDDTFTMDYRHPLSAFQAFAICLTSFGTKLACE